MQYLQDANGTEFVKPYDLDPMKNFLEIDQVAGIPLQIFDLAYDKPCSIPEGHSSVSGSYPNGTAYYEGWLTRTGPNLKFLLTLQGSIEHPFSRQVTGYALFAKNLPLISKSFPMSGWGMVGKARQLPEGTTLDQVIGAN